MEVAVSERYGLSLYPVSAPNLVLPLLHATLLSALPCRTPPLSTPPSHSRGFSGSLAVSFPPNSLLDPGGVGTGDREGRREWSSPRKRNTTSPAAIAGSPFNGSFVVAWEGVWQPCATSHPLSTPTFRSVGMGERDGTCFIQYKRNWERDGYIIRG